MWDRSQDSRSLEIAAMGPTPFCGMLLGDMGADVLRVDRIENVEAGLNFPTTFDLRSRNKRSVSIDLKQPGGIAALLRLVEQADVLLEGFRPGVAERLGFGPETCFALQPQLVYGRATGWGQDGPLAQAAGHDINYIALAGVLDLIGSPDAGPATPLNLIGDYGGGALYLAFGVLCAVLEARTSKKGQVVDMAMIDGTASLLTVFHALRQSGEHAYPRGTNVLDGGAPYYTTYLARDGRYVAVGAIEARFYHELLKRLDLDPAALPSRDDRANWPELRARIGERFLMRTRDEWTKHFEGSDACFTPVLSIEEARSHPHSVAREMFVPFEGAQHPRPAPRLSRTPGSIRSRAPHRAQHTVQALRDWGFDEEQISAGLLSGVIGLREEPVR